MFADEPFVLERGYLTEQMTDDEISALNDSVELYLNGCEADSDCIIAYEINRKLWKPVWAYRKRLDEYFSEEDDWDAEQDH